MNTSWRLYRHRLYKFALAVIACVRIWAGVAAKLLIPLSICGGALAGVYLGFKYDLPDADHIKDYTLPLGTEVYSDDGQLIGKFALERRHMVPYEQIPRQLRQAIIAAEDRNFFVHFGLDPIGILRAAYQNAQAGRIVAGGSTVTQQVARNLFLGQERTYERKVREAILAFDLERCYTKEQILALYCNLVYMGHGRYGVAAAAEYYFGKKLDELTLPECALLAALPRSPMRYSPYLNPDLARARRNYVLDRMAEEGFISGSVAERCKSMPLGVRERGRERQRQLAPYFVEMVRRYLAKRYSTEEIWLTGLRVYTTLNVQMQKAAEEAIIEGLNAYRERAARSPGCALEVDPNQVQGALVAIDNRTGQIRAMVGGCDFSTSEFNRAVQAHRQPGSAFKPFVYAAALEAGLKPDDYVIDAPISFRGGDGKVWSPQNYDRKFKGRITLRTALAESRNVPAVRLAAYVGLDRVIEMAKRLGISSPMSPYLPTALGATEVTLLELTSAYSVFPNGGLHARPYFIRRIEDHKGRVLEEYGPRYGRALSPEVAQAMVHLLRGVVEFGTATKAKELQAPVAGKTGTANDFTDAWFVGFSPELTAGVWVGFDEKRSLGDKETGARVALPIWISFMRQTLNVKPARNYDEMKTLMAGVTNNPAVTRGGELEQGGIHGLTIKHSQSPNIELGLHGSNQIGRN